MQPRQFRAGRVERVLTTMAVVAWLFTIAIAVWAGKTAGFLTVQAVVLVLLTMSMLQTWRWRVTVHEQGLTVQPGLGHTRSVTWDEVEDVRAERPRALELCDGGEVRLGGLRGPPVTESQARELQRVIGERQSG